MLLYKFFKEGCSPCSTLKKIMHMIELPEDIELVEIDVLNPNQNLLIPQDVVVEQVPMLLFENGNRLVGVKSKPKLEVWINSYGDQII